MLSQLGPLFKTVFRKAEQSDARLEIRREEKENQKQKDDKKDEEVKNIDLWEDTTYVSIDALRSFLNDFLKSHGNTALEKDSKPKQQNPNDNMHSSTQQNRINTQAARAQQAYATTSHYAVPTEIQEPDEQPSEKISLIDLLKSDEIRTIHILITELDYLAKKNVHTLVIEKAETFLKALVMAVEKEKNNF